MESAENLGFNLPALLLQVVSFLVLLGLLYFAAYRPIMRRINKRSQEAKENTEQIVRELSGETERRMAKYISEANKRIQNLRNKLEQNESMTRQRVRDENSKALESIVRKARVKIGKERDDAIREVHQEYDDLVVRNAENEVSHKGE